MATCQQFFRFTPDAIFSDLSLIRKNNPLVHNITNYVAMPTIANMLLALGASPLMAHAPAELAELSNITKALVLNIGTLDQYWIQAMQQAQTLAKQKTIPIILDPVGAGASKYRTQATLALLENDIAILRGNASEIMALVDQDRTTKGVDTTSDSLAALQTAKYLAKKYACVVVVSGATDIIVNSQYLCYLHKSSFSFFTKVTAMGCSATGIIGAFAAINKDYFVAAVHAMVILGMAGEKATLNSVGPGMFYANLLDALYHLTVDDLEQQLTITETELATEITLTAKSIAPKYPSDAIIKQVAKPKIDYSLYLVADSAICSHEMFPQLVAKVVTQGITCVQLRGKSLSEQQLLQTGRELLKILRPLKIPLIINDSIAIAKRLDADGVHLGQKDCTVEFARQELGAHKIIGLSLENVEQAHRCARLDVDYFGVGPVFTSTTKLDAAIPINIQGLQAIKSIILDKPVIAIGGVNISNAASVMSCGVDGIAVASAILSVPDQAKATKQLRHITNSASQSTAPLYYHCVLSIAGSDSSGGAGVQADIKTIAATGGYAASVITALTAQNTLGVSAIHDVSAEFVAAQLDSVFQDMNFSAVKIGMLHRSDIIEMVAAKLQQWEIKKIVLDPVMVAKGGDQLITADALLALKQRLFPLVYLITPNLPEAEILLQNSINSPQQMEQAAQKLATTYQVNVLIKGGHLHGDRCDDVLFCYNKQKSFWFSGLRIASKNTHGTGCTFSAAVASYLAQGNNLFDAITKAKNYVTNAINAGSHYLIGHGHGPLHHFANMCLNTTIF